MSKTRYLYRVDFAERETSCIHACVHVVTENAEKAIVIAKKSVKLAGLSNPVYVSGVREIDRNVMIDQ